MTLNELKEIKVKIVENNISLEVAKELLFKSTEVSWHSKDWIDRQKEIIKSYCEQCGGTKNLLIQHFWHPKKYGEHRYQAIVKYGNIYSSENLIDELVSLDEIKEYIKKATTIKKSVCPKCGYSYRERKTKTPKYICNNCSFEFFEPLEVIEPSFIDDFSQSIIKIKPYETTYTAIGRYLYKSKCKVGVIEKYGFAIERETLLNLIDEYIKYQSFEDTKTWCKKCAFNYDINHADLCPVCKRNYKKFNYIKCRECAGLKKEKEKASCENCEFCMFGNNKIVCAGGSDNSIYKYGEEITDFTKVCENWSRAFEL